VSQFFLLPAAVLIPDSDRVRVDEVRACGLAEIELVMQGRRRTPFRVHAARNLRSIEFVESDGVRRKIKISSARGGTRYFLDLCGVHRVRLRLGSELAPQAREASGQLCGLRELAG